MARYALRWVLILGLLHPMATTAQEAVPEGPTVHGVLFYSPTCPHCREVMTETLPPILERYGPALEIVTINVATAGGQQLYTAMIETLAVPRDRVGVPTLLVGDRILVGSWEVPNLLPGIADTALAATGIDWPPVPLIRRALAAQGLIAPEDVAIAEPSPAPASTPEPTAEPAAETVPEPTAEPAAEPAPEPTAEPAPEVATEQAAEPKAEPAPEPSPEQETEPAPAPAPEPAADQEPEPAVEPAPEPAAGQTAEPTTGPAQEAAGVAPEEAAAPETDTVDAALAGAIDREGEAALAEDLTVKERVMLDPAGNGLAVGVLILMLGALGLVFADRTGTLQIPTPPAWAIPMLTVVGLGVAGYLAYVEVTGAEAVCGPVGNCNVVQQSPYARVFGVAVGVLGVLGYLALLVAWTIGRVVDRWAAVAREAVWWMALVATGFSIYLTFLEPFVIGASCAWCLTSAALTTLILIAASPERRRAAG